MTLKEQLEDDRDQVADQLKDANILSVISLARLLCENVAEWLRDQPREEDEEPDELDEDAARSITGAVAELDEAEDIMLRAGWQYP